MPTLNTDPAAGGCHLLRDHRGLPSMPETHLPALSRSDFEREARITDLRQNINRCLKARMKVQAHAYWRQLSREIAARSPNQVAYLEIQKGLR